MRRIVALVLLAIAFGCSNAESPSQPRDVQDISSMSLRVDGLYNVTCRDGHFEVRSAAEVRNGSVCDIGGNAGASTLFCVARDNDGQNPWVLALLDQNGALTRLAGTSLATIDDCHRVIAGRRYNGRNSITCLSRDNDGQNPWIVGQINFDSASVTRLDGLSFATLDECLNGISSAPSYQNRLMVCAARDNDGQNPWIVAQFDQYGTATRMSNLVYSTIDQCRSAVGSARWNGNALLICGTRDQDGSNPWNIYRVDATTATRLDLTYATLQACLQGG